MTEQQNGDKLWPWPVYAMAGSVPVSVAATSVSKLLVLLFGLAALAGAIARQTPLPVLARLRSPQVILLMLAALALSLSYTAAPPDMALNDLAKYGKLLVIVLVPVLLCSPRQAIIALGVYAAAQTFVIVSSYLLSAGLVLPWVPKLVRTSPGTVYSSYIDQSIMTAGLAFLCWHLRHQFPGRHGPKLAIGLALLASVNVLFLLPGRTGQVALLVGLTLALFWAIPGPARVIALLAPLLVVSAAMAVSPQFRERLADVVTESRAFGQGERELTSSGLRLQYWQRSVQSLAERPWTGHGVGSWNSEFKRLEGDLLVAHSALVRNPHQEYLHWGVQLGLGGIALLLALLAALARDSWHFAGPVRRSALTLVAILAAVCLFNSTLFDALIGDYFCLMLGLLFTLGLRAQTGPAAAPR